MAWHLSPSLRLCGTERTTHPGRQKGCLNDLHILSFVKVICITPQCIWLNSSNMKSQIKSSVKAIYILILWIMHTTETYFGVMCSRAFFLKDKCAFKKMCHSVYFFSPLIWFDFNLLWTIWNFRGLPVARVGGQRVKNSSCRNVLCKWPAIAVTAWMAERGGAAYTVHCSACCTYCAVPLWLHNWSAKCNWMGTPSASSLPESQSSASSESSNTMRSLAQKASCAFGRCVFEQKSGFFPPASGDAESPQVRWTSTWVPMAPW